MELGHFDLCLRVKDLDTSIEFYRKLGFENTRSDLQAGWAVMKRRDCSIALYNAFITEPILNFRGGDVFEIADVLKKRGLELETEACVEEDGSKGAMLRDPDGHLIYFNTAPGEEVTSPRPS